VHVPLHGATHARIVHEEEVHDFQVAMNSPPAKHGVAAVDDPRA
jgi:hypothetical protein